MKYTDGWFGVLSKSALINLNDYYQQSESLLESAKNTSLSRIEEQVNRMRKERNLTEDDLWGEREALIAADHEVSYNIFFPNLFRYSIIILVTVILEDHLNKLSWTLYKLKANELPSPNPTGDTIKDCKAYINKFNLSYDQSIWEFVDDLICIRNCIVHASGDVSRRNPDQESQLNDISKKNIGVSIKDSRYTHLYLDDDTIIIEPRYCECIIRDVTILFETLCKAANLPTGIKVDFHNNESN